MRVLKLSLLALFIYKIHEVIVNAIKSGKRWRQTLLNNNDGGFNDDSKLLNR